MPRRTIIALLAVGVIAGCAQTTQDARVDLLDRPIDCATADLDIAALETAIPGAGERAAAGVRLVVPVARIAGRVRGELDERREIASGRTEDDLRARMAEIEAACPDSRAPNAVAEG
ncbi:hypothetical protein [Roseivivax isoporae]|uniref:Lipoprotein n=1 Tax=Roseivivax isoporae LMG 25204 TaxID=1449351 RepID=X7F3Q4_9RHOB|nr:hypothetical protein [Roseivivax isoporae]ETX26736.1 hypothetical protein RISW2_19420 [Roseivivax isoporae LMG 25204]